MHREARGGASYNDPRHLAQFGRSFGDSSWGVRISGLSGRDLGTTFLGFFFSFEPLSLEPMINLLYWYLVHVPDHFGYARGRRLAVQADVSVIRNHPRKTDDGGADVQGLFHPSSNDLRSNWYRRWAKVAATGDPCQAPKTIPKHRSHTLRTAGQAEIDAVNARYSQIGTAHISSSQLGMRQVRIAELGVP